MHVNFENNPETASVVYKVPFYPNCGGGSWRI